MSKQGGERRRSVAVHRLLMLGFLGSYACGDSAVQPEPAVTTIVVTPSAAQVFATDTVRFRAEARSVSGQPVAGVSFSWSTTRSDVATVDPSGLVTGWAPGPARVVATAHGRSGAADLEVMQRPPEPIESVDVTPLVADLAVGDTLRLSAVARPFGGGSAPGVVVTWTTDRSDVATVDAGGLVTAWAGGDANITATANGVSGRALIRVGTAASAPPVIAGIDPQSIQAGWGNFTLSVQGSGFQTTSRVRWEGVPLETFFVSGTELRATVLASYVRNEGAAEVTVENPAPQSMVSNAWTFTVFSRPALTVDLLVAGNAVVVGDRVRLDAVARDQFGQVIDGKTITWSSSDTTVARLEGGYVRGLRLGSVQLVASATPTSSSMTLAVVEAPFRSVLFEAGPPAGRQLFVRSLSPVGGVRPLLPPGTTGSQAAASLDGNRIAFVGTDATGNRDIWVVNVDGSGLRRLTTDPALDDQPAWSPDGRLLAFRSFRQGKSDVWIMNADGSAQRNLTFAGAFVPEEVNDRPTWSADGGTLVFSRGFGVGQALYKVRPDGTGMALFVSRAGMDLVEPAWSHDGAVIAFRAYDRSQRRSTVEFVSAATGDPMHYFWPAPPDAWTPTMLSGGWMAVSAPVLPGTAIRTVALLHLLRGEVVVPMGAEYGELLEPAVVLR